MLAIVATDEKNGIGKNNQLLCHLPDDLKYFKSLTINNIIVMGRKTYESIGKPLPNRINVVLSQNPHLKIDGVEVYYNIESLIQKLPQKYPNKKIIIIGGEQIYRLFFPYIQKIYRTFIHHTFDADAFFPDFKKEFKLIQSTPHPKDEKHLYAFDFQVWERIND